jgi:hypothetical protein
MQFSEIVEKLGTVVKASSLTVQPDLNPDIQGVAAVEEATPQTISYIEGVKFAAIKQGNLTTGNIHVQKFSITPGLSLATIFEYDEFQLIPQVSASYTNSPLIKSKKLEVKNAQNRILSDNKISVAKHSYHFGASLSLVSERIETSIGYERTGQSKYLGHTGYLKLRINI